MLKFKVDYCSAPGCRYYGPLVNATKKLCRIHNEARLAARRKPKPKKLVKRVYKKWKAREPMKKRPRVPTGEATMFKVIWEKREHYCQNCQIFLGNEMHTYNFAHIIPKSRGEKYRLDENNIRLLCLDCHHALDHGTKQQYLNRSNINYYGTTAVT